MSSNKPCTTQSITPSLQVESARDKNRPIPTTTSVMLQGLVQKPHLNGRVGICMGYQCHKERYIIQLTEPWTDPDKPSNEQSHKLCLRRANIVVLRRAEGSNCMDLHDICRGCHKSFGLDYIQKCAKCKVARYCSKACQKHHWLAGHKKLCSTLRTARKEPEPLPSIQHVQDRHIARNIRIERYKDAGKYAKAEQELRLLLQEVPMEEDAIYWVEITQCLCGQGRFDEAIDTVQRILGVPRSESENNTVAIAYKVYGWLLKTHKRDIEGARHAFQAGLNLNPDNEILKLELRKSLDEIRKIQHAQDRQTARNIRIEQYKDAGKYAKAEQEIRLLMQEVPMEEDAVYWLEITQCLCGQGRFDEAIDTFQRILGVPRSESEKNTVAIAYKIYGWLLKTHKRDIEGARHAFQAGLNLNPDNEILKLELRKSLDEIRKIAAAQQYMYSSE